MFGPSYQQFSILLPYCSNFYQKLLTPPLGTSLNEGFNKAFAWSPKLVLAFYVLKWHKKLTIENLKFRVQCSSWVCIFLCRSCLASHFKLENPTINQNQEPQIEQSQSGVFLRCCKCQKPCGKTLKGAQIYPGRVPIPFQAGWVFIAFLRDWWYLRITCIQICSATTKERLRIGPGKAAGICRQAGSFLVGPGKLNLACWAWQNRDWWRYRASIVDVELGAAINWPGINLGWKYKRFVTWQWAALSLDCDPLVFFGKSYPW